MVIILSVKVTIILLLLITDKKNNEVGINHLLHIIFLVHMIVIYKYTEPAKLYMCWTAAVVSLGVGTIQLK